jgi:DNA helicase-2/ATP-dependent DNA helicase PcrA
MANRLIIAAAGSGKTTRVVREALGATDKRTLVTTFTVSNEREITKKFYELNGCIPSHVVVQTWFSFLLEHGVKPFQGPLTDRKIGGVFLVNGASSRYVSEDNFDRYYCTKDFQVYSDKLAKLVVKCNQKSNGRVVERISRVFPRIFIDEVQDMSGYDLALMKLLMQSVSSVLIVGDPRQTTYGTHDEIRYKKYKNGKIREFVQNECGLSLCEIDASSLRTSYRCGEKICRIADQLYPEYTPCSSAQTEVTGHDGVFLVRKTDVARYLTTFKPMQLRDTRRVSVSTGFPAMNFGDAKGLTFDRVLIYPTADFVKWLKDRRSDLKPRTRSRFYVGITRAKYSASIVMDFSEQTAIDGVEKHVFND